MTISSRAPLEGRRVARGNDGSKPFQPRVELKTLGDSRGTSDPIVEWDGSREVPEILERFGESRGGARPSVVALICIDDPLKDGDGASRLLSIETGVGKTERELALMRGPEDFDSVGEKSIDPGVLSPRDQRGGNGLGGGEPLAQAQY